MKHQNQPIRSSEKEAEELMKHGHVVGRVGVDATRKGLMKLSKVVFHNTIYILYISNSFRLLDSNYFFLKFGLFYFHNKTFLMI